jgi:hypothetical protein
MRKRGLQLLEAHIRSLDPDAPTARERLESALGEPFARELVRTLSLVEVRLDEDVLSRRLGAQVEQVERSRQLAEEARAVSCDDRRDEEQELVDEPCPDERRRERRAAFEQE